MADKTLPQRLRARRLELDLTLREVAERSGLSLPYVSNLERGARTPTLDALKKLATALETSTSEVLGGQAGLDDEQLLVDSLASAPRSLIALSRTDTFREQVSRWAKLQGVPEEEMRTQVLSGMAAAPRRSAEEPSADDWRRLLDAYDLILRSD